MLQIDSSKCIKCGNCVKECPGSVFDMTETGPIIAFPEICIICGHCLAVCPVDAIRHAQMPFEEFHEIKDPQISFEQFNYLAQNRRSIRRYKNKPLDPTHIDLILKSVQCIPTGSNLQELEYLVISDPEILKKIRNAMAKKFNLGRNLLNNPVTRSFVSLATGKQQVSYLRSGANRIMQKYQEGEDPLLRGAPTLIIIHSATKTPMAQLDAGIAGYHINLVSETLGIGTCWIGFHSALAQNFANIRKISQIPKGHKVLATIALGYPAMKYRKICPRKPIKIQKI